MALRCHLWRPKRESKPQLILLGKLLNYLASILITFIPPNVTLNQLINLKYSAILGSKINTYNIPILATQETSQVIHYPFTSAKFHP